MLKLFAFATPNNLKAVILLEELGLEYELLPVNLRQGEQKAAAFVQRNPNAKVPVLVDETAGRDAFVLTESAAILVYLAEKHAQFLPATGPERARVFEQLFFHASGISPAFGNAGYFQKLAPETVPIAIDRFQGEARRLMRVLDTTLADAAYVAGAAYSIADMAHFGWLWRSAFAGIDVADTPRVQRWYEHLAVRPAVQAAMAKLEALVPPTV